MLSALTNYLQHQPAPGNDTSTQQAAAANAVNAATDSAEAADLNGLYSPSQRALMVSAVATDFDVHALTPDQTSALQQKLQQYGLVSTSDLNAFAAIHMARSDMNEEDTLDAVAILDNAREQFTERGTGYSERQQITRLNTLMHNIASARITQ
ncbi:MAG: hypothetical protein CMI03_18575 [Oceanospirillaceae bacterium]|uniref:hypothetical protein n=1 Tax=unclassified Thalassolituus TaxID=2624967 RepID=UPI000C4E4E3B|nr:MULTISPECIES: hypothetical protein [unclassified Thalassolituus]MAS23849.1 hypothetical protein [Oceanospirillaceae bacterium]MBL34407.1 hypothetical protein [Oceanospirillaceae bacterium]MBS54748.1 hypothetical protein [Oceanospirillaceae bacterium]|tara:strand:- start:4693 stop:5151 length:459 start_codon:yes stop_codon:yes gene_type:complete